MIFTVDSDIMLDTKSQSNEQLANCLDDEQHQHELSGQSPSRRHGNSGTSSRRGVNCGHKKEDISFFFSSASSDDLESASTSASISASTTPPNDSSNLINGYMAKSKSNSGDTVNNTPTASVHLNEIGEHQLGNKNNHNNNNSSTTSTCSSSSTSGGGSDDASDTPVGQSSMVINTNNKMEKKSIWPMTPQPTSCKMNLTSPIPLNKHNSKIHESAHHSLSSSSLTYRMIQNKRFYSNLTSNSDYPSTGSLNTLHDRSLSDIFGRTFISG